MKNNCKTQRASEYAVHIIVGKAMQPTKSSNAVHVDYDIDILCCHASL